LPEKGIRLFGYLMKMSKYIAMEDSLLFSADFLPISAKNTSVPNTTAVQMIATPFKSVQDHYIKWWFINLFF